MKQWLMNLVLLSVPACLVPAGFGQTEDEIERAVESIEQLAEDLGSSVEQIGQSVEKMVEENSREMEKWAESHASEWERWAARHEQQLNQWAKDQERTWENWAEQYSGKWEHWPEFESAELDSGQLNQLIEQNLEMLGNMPLGQLADSMLDEGTAALKDAPWDSLQQLQSGLADAIENTVADAMRQQTESTPDKDRSIDRRQTESTRDRDRAIERRQMDRDQANERRQIPVETDEARMVLRRLKQQLAEGKLDAEQLRSLLEQWSPDSADGTNEESNNKMQARRESVMQHRREADERLRLETRNRAQAIPTPVQKQRDRKAPELAEQNPQALASQRFVESLQQIREGDESSASAREALRRAYQQLEAEERRNQEQKSELDALRRDLRQLRHEVEKMKSNDK